jgi:hypothetical protein
MFVQLVFVSLLALLLGIAICFAGYRLFLILLPVWAFFAGFLVTAQAIQELFGGGFLVTTGSWVFGFVVGVLCALAAYFVYVAAIVVLAAGAGYELGVGVISGLGVSSGVLLFLVGLIVAAVLTAAVILLNLPKVLIVALTAAVGAGMILTGILLALGRVSLDALRWGIVGDFIHSSWLWSLVFLVIGGAGIAVQLFFPEGYALAPYGQEQASP